MVSLNLSHTKCDSIKHECGPIAQHEYIGSLCCTVIPHADVFENIMKIKAKYTEKLVLSKCSFSFLIENKSSLIQYITTTFSPLYSS